MVRAPVLALPNTNDPFILDTDASDKSVGAELIQIQEGEERAVAYGSLTLTIWTPLILSHLSLFSAFPVETQILATLGPISYLPREPRHLHPGQNRTSLNGP
jgi:hypothetical protein